MQWTFWISAGLMTSPLACLAIRVPLGIANKRNCPYTTSNLSQVTNLSSKIHYCSQSSTLFSCKQSQSLFPVSSKVNHCPQFRSPVSAKSITVPSFVPSPVSFPQSVSAGGFIMRVGKLNSNRLATKLGSAKRAIGRLSRWRGKSQVGVSFITFES